MPGGHVALTKTFRSTRRSPPNLLVRGQRAWTKLNGVLLSAVVSLSSSSAITKSSENSASRKG